MAQSLTNEEELRALTTVQQRGQNHQRRARARSRKRISRAIARMEPSDCGAKRKSGQSRGRPCVQPTRARVGHGNTCGLPLPSPICRFKAHKKAQLVKKIVETLPIILSNPHYIANSHEK